MEVITDDYGIGDGKKGNRLLCNVWTKLVLVLAESNGNAIFVAGFGGVTPKTKLGKMLVIPYALVTIPLMLTLLASFGTIASSWAEGIMLLVHRITRGNKPLRYRLIKRCFYLYIVVWIASAFFYSVAASSPYVLDTFYFIQVTFSTIGFGDIEGPANKIDFYVYWLIFGLAAFSGFADSVLAAAPRVKFGVKRGNASFCFRYIEDEELEGFTDTSSNRNNDLPQI